MRFGWKATGPTIRSTDGSSQPTSWAIDQEMDPDGLANFLANHPDVKGIGPVKARLIADHFGRGFDAAIRSQPEAVAAAAKVPVEIDRSISSASGSPTATSTPPWLTCPLSG